MSNEFSVNRINTIAARACSQVRELDFSPVVLAVLRRDVLAVPVAEDAVAHRGGQSPGVFVAHHVPGAGVGAAGARPTVRPRGGYSRGIRSAAHCVPAVRVPGTLGPVLFRHVRDAHLPRRPFRVGEQGRQPVRVTHVLDARLDRHLPGRLPVRLAHRIGNFTTIHRYCSLGDCDLTTEKNRFC